MAGREVLADMIHKMPWNFEIKALPVTSGPNPAQQHSNARWRAVSARTVWPAPL